MKNRVGRSYHFFVGAFFIWLLSGLVLLAMSQDIPEEIGGKATVVDGDTVRFSVRFQGIDAPELHQQCAGQDGACWACGKQAAAALRTWVKAHDGRLRCTIETVGKYGRFIGVCYVGDRDVSLALLEQGLAVPVERYLQQTPALYEPYMQAYKRAKATALGMHRGAFIPPYRWRRGVRLDCEDLG